ncbi:unannotated protein [freshwater metagenome]|uniref:Unannotated protein n=1 Tax=freshwater metagenome TaxID=449393 RepID=A0A6J6S5U1_9ZZZZ
MLVGESMTDVGDRSGEYGQTIGLPARQRVDHLEGVEYRCVGERTACGEVPCQPGIGIGCVAEPAFTDTVGATEPCARDLDDADQNIGVRSVPEQEARRCGGLVPVHEALTPSSPPGRLPAAWWANVRARLSSRLTVSRRRLARAATSITVKP